MESSSLTTGIVPTIDDDRMSFLAFLSTPNRPPNERPRFSSISSDSSRCSARSDCSVLLLDMNLCNRSLGCLSICKEKFSIALFLLPSSASPIFSEQQDIKLHLLSYYPDNDTEN
ncbi:hypothetical protein L6164_020898 [Bauhinia variegata]|uniref:Uncharacterized protein n=1 Tax=Bauhinia variegata TaxID=167791 RepID=A0ACB9MYJ3_BAUVA|nr:hypothetical protein L6164_020898 [Bauhinia variegata]